jgi:hypothetical protein
MGQRATQGAPRALDVAGNLRDTPRRTMRQTEGDQDEGHPLRDAPRDEGYRLRSLLRSRNRLIADSEIRRHLFLPVPPILGN